MIGLASATTMRGAPVELATQATAQSGQQVWRGSREGPVGEWCSPLDGTAIPGIDGIAAAAPKACRRTIAGELATSAAASTPARGTRINEDQRDLSSA